MKPPAANASRQITTPEGLTLSLTLASRGARISALVLDLIILLVLAVALTIALAYLGSAFIIQPKAPATAPALQALYILWTAALFLMRNAWFLAFELGPRGATPGKRMMGIRIAAQHGQRLTPEMVIARNLMRDIELFVPIGIIATVGGTPGTIAALAWLGIFTAMPLYNRNRLRTGDLIAGTWVVETPRRKLASALSTLNAAYRFAPHDLAIYGEFELQTLERVLRDGAQEPMAAVARTICAKIGWSAPEAAHIQPFLEAYYLQLRARLEAGMQMGRRKVDKFDGMGVNG